MSEAAVAVGLGDAEARDATRDLYARHGRQIYRYCFHQLRKHEEAEDATQVTFLNAFRSLKQGVTPQYESAWLFTVARNVCLNNHRSSARRRLYEVPSDLDLPDNMLVSRQPDIDELFGMPEALQALPIRQRRALLLREWQGLSQEEIATELDLSQASVEMLLFRARRSLAEKLTRGTDERKPRSRMLDAASV